MEETDISIQYKEKCEELWNKCPEKVIAAHASLFNHCITVSQTFAVKWLENLDKYLWDNYLTEEECIKIGNVMNGGTKGYFWTIPEIKALLKENKFPEHMVGKYNLYALVTVINMCWSDHSELIKELTGLKINEKHKLFITCYKMALDFLLDADGMFYVRKYFSDIID